VEAERWRRLEELFHRAVDLGPAERDVLLDAECGSDAGLRAELERLVQRDDGQSDLFSRTESRARPDLEDPMLGRTLGAYRLTARLAAGGMGVVYRAERSDGLFQQEVAIKLIRAERATEWMLRRFEFERRTLAALEHPCIARLYDGGTTEDGSPYFVMELVRGEAIDRYCQRERLPVAARVRLFLQVCRAVQFAHQKLVVHCDIKPSNILIDERGVPRLLDFGIARLLEDGSDEARTAATRTIARVFTPEYASPEQLAGGPVTTSFDVYALGVVLYELATGLRPFPVESRSPADWERLVREQMPERPSTRVSRAVPTRDASTIAAGFHSTPAGLRRALRGDLDRIVMMALRKEADRRYASVQELADDLERHLAGQPVRARPDSVAYRATKFVRRNRVAVAASAAVLSALVFGIVAARSGQKAAEMEAQHARIEADSFQAVSNFLMDAFLPAQPSQDAAWQERARGLIRAQAERVHRQYQDQDHQRANLLDTLGHVSRRLDLLDDAHRLMREALAIREQAFGPRSLEYALSLRSLGQLEYQTGDYAEAARRLEEALLIHRAAGSSTHSDVAALANDLAACLRNIGRAAEAGTLHREALVLRREAGDGTLPVAESLNNLSAVHMGGGEFALAVAELREALAIRDSILGGEHLLTLQTMSNLATALWRHDERAEARDWMRRAESGYRALRGDGEDGLGLVLANLAAMQLAENDQDGAAASLEEALALQTRRLGGDHPLVAETLAKLAVSSHARRDDAAAREYWQEAVRVRRAAPSSGRELADALYGYGVFLSDVDECEPAVPLLEEAIGLHRSEEAADPLALGRAQLVLGRCLWRAGRLEAAREHLLEAARLLDASPGATADERSKARGFVVETERPAAAK